MNNEPLTCVLPIAGRKLESPRIGSKPLSASVVGHNTQQWQSGFEKLPGLFINLPGSERMHLVQQMK